jgi:sialate O-acetylesterase
VALVRDWRTRFAQGQLPFYCVQLASYRGGPNWPLLREAQAAALSEPGTGMVVSLDIGDPDDIHPKNKREVGRRLALLARAETYGQAGVLAHGPTLSQLSIRGDDVRVRFAHARGLRTRDGGAVRGFAVAGDDGRFVAAPGAISGNEVRLEVARGTAPRAVRYAWADVPDENLENDAGLPAAPFRSDGFAS